LNERAASEKSSTAGDVILVVREALSNVGRHAAAATCRVTLRQHDTSTITLKIDDGGLGFDRPTSAHVSMRWEPRTR
jgi:signal transduction histidine kinase